MPNTTELPAPLGDEHYCIPSTLNRKPPLSKLGLNDLHQIVPLHHTRDFLPGCLLQAHLDIFRLHDQQPLNLWHCSHCTAQPILSTVGVESLIGKGEISTGMLFPGGVTHL